MEIIKHLTALAQFLRTRFTQKMVAYIWTTQRSLKRRVVQIIVS